MAEELHPTETPLASGASFPLFFFFILLLLKSQREPLLPPLKRCAPGGRPPGGRLPGAARPLPAGLGVMKSPGGGWGVSSFTHPFLLLVCNFNHSAHIKESVFQHKNQPRSVCLG